MLSKVKQYATEFDLSVIAYCLMPNHYHLLVRQDGDSRAGLLPQRVFNSYSKAYNKRYQHSGTLFQGPYQVIDIDDQGYLLHLCRYIHANPVKDGFVIQPADWPYSNFLEWVGLRTGSLIDIAFVSYHFPSPSAYIEFVNDYLLTRTHPAEIAAYLDNI